MTLKAIVTNKSVTFENRVRNITFNLVLTEEDIQVLNKDFSVTFRIGQDSISQKIEDISNLMQQAIDDYKSSEAIFSWYETNNKILNSPALSRAVINIQNGLVL